MTTNVAGNQARNQARQVLNTKRLQVNYNDAGLTAGYAFLTVPAGSFITGVLFEVVTPFDGGGILSAGKNGGMNDLIAAADVDETVAGVYEVTRGVGRSLTAAGDTTFSIKLSVAATVGQGELVVMYEGNNG